MKLIRLGEVDRATTLAADVRAGLSAQEKTLPSKYLYDARGGELFDRITRLPEYYPTRTERAILAENAAGIATLARTETLIEIGSGTSEKTRLLLSAMRAAGTLRRFVAFDVDPLVLESASRSIAADYSPIEVLGLVGDFEQHLDRLPRYPHRMVAFLGSTIGNLDRDGRGRLLRAVAATMGPDGTFLLGVDLVKSVERLEAAYDDSAGVTAEFNKNILGVLNRELGAAFDLDAFDHVARWDVEHSWIDVRLRSQRQQCVPIASLGMDVLFDAGETIWTEISAKFTRAGIESELWAAGLRPTAWWTDPAGDFGLSLSASAA